MAILNHKLGLVLTSATSVAELVEANVSISLWPHRRTEVQGALTSLDQKCAYWPKLEPTPYSSLKIRRLRFLPHLFFPVLGVFLIFFHSFEMFNSAIVAVH